MNENTLVASPISQVLANADHLATEADQIITNHVFAAVAMGTVPLPLVDLAGLTVIKTRMIKRLGQLYGYNPTEKQINEWIIALTGSTASVFIGPRLLGSLFKFVPVVGQLAGAFGVSVSAGAITYGLGVLFRDHFKNGGHPLKINAENMKPRLQKLIDSYKKKEEAKLEDEEPAQVTQTEQSGTVKAEPTAEKENEATRQSSDESEPSHKATNAPKASPAGKGTEPDDLKKLEGIGPKIQELLFRNGIKTYRKLADTAVETLNDILENSGNRFNFADPSTWRKQASLAAEGSWDELKEFMNKLKGGRIVSDEES